MSDDIAGKGGVRELGVMKFSLLMVVRSHCLGRWAKTTLRDLQEKSGMSKHTIIDKLKELRDGKLIEVETRNEAGRKTTWMRDRPWKVRCKDAPPSPSGDIYSCIDIKGKKEEEKKPAWRADKNLKAEADRIIAKVLAFERYDNAYYKNREWKFGAREEGHVRNFLSQVKDPDAYLDWWIKKKASRIHGLSLGLVLCQPMIEEWLIGGGARIGKDKALEKNIKKHAEGSMRLRIEEASLLVEQIRKEPEKELSKSDKEFLGKCVADGLIEVKDGRHQMAGGM